MCQAHKDKLFKVGQFYILLYDRMCLYKQDPGFACTIHNVFILLLTFAAKLLLSKRVNTQKTCSILGHAATQPPKYIDNIKTKC